MKVAELRSDLLHKIEGLDAHQLKDVYGLIQNYFNAGDSTEEWHQLPPSFKEKIDHSIAQANTGNSKPLSEVTARLRRKYKING